MSNETPEKPSGLNLGRAGVDAIKKLQLEHTTARLHLCLQYGVLLVALGLIVYLSVHGKLDATVAALLSTVLGYGLRSTQVRNTK